MDFDVQRCTRRCSKTEREFGPGENFYSALVAEGAKVVRYDYSVEAWEGPPEATLGWWKSKMPSPDARKLHWAPNDVMLEYFEQIDGQEEKLDVRYVLALLMIRRRLVRPEETETDDAGRETLVLYCPRRETTYKVVAMTVDETRTKAIQDELAELLFADAA